MSRYYATWETQAPPPAWQPCSGVWVLATDPQCGSIWTRMGAFIEAPTEEVARYLVYSAYPGSKALQLRTVPDDATHDPGTGRLLLASESIHAIRGEDPLLRLIEIAESIDQTLWRAHPGNSG